MYLTSKYQKQKVLRKIILKAGHVKDKKEKTNK